MMKFWNNGVLSRKKSELQSLYWICRCLDTRKSKDLTGILIADIVLQLLSYVAQTEREFIRQRQKEGIAAAKARGVKFGREPMQRPAEFDMIKAQWEEDNISAREAAKQLGITHKTFLKWVKEEKMDKKVEFSPHEACICTIIYV